MNKITVTSFSSPKHGRWKWRKENVRRTACRLPGWESAVRLLATTILVQSQHDAPITGLLSLPFTTCASGFQFNVLRWYRTYSHR